MKRILFAFTILACVLPAAHEAKAADVSLNFFYDNLGSDGNWLEVADYGYVWQPSIAATRTNWRPYSDGYWAYTDVGWTWVSYEDFGWATYHYGRWARLADRGWVWVPGDHPVWGPAWVSWRTGGDYVGWAPLPPGGSGGEVVYEGRPITGHVDFDYDIGPSYYNFVDVRFIGEPVLRDHIYDYNQNVTYINKTVNVTNITYNNSTVYNYGPDYNTLSSYSTRPIQRLTLQRQTNFDPAVTVQSGMLTKVQGDKLVVGAPMQIQKAAVATAPKVVKEKIGQPKFDRGWGAVSDQKAQAQLRQKMKTEDGKNVPPPDIKPHGGAAVSALTAPAMTPAIGTSPATPPLTTSPAASVAASIAPAATAAPANANGAVGQGQGKGKGKNRHAELAQPAGASSPGATAAMGASTDALDNGKRHKGRRSEAQLAPTPTDNATGMAPTPSAQTAPVNQENTGRGAGKKHKEQRAEMRQNVAPANDASGAAAAPLEEQSTGNGHGKHRGERRAMEMNQPPANGAVPTAPDGATQMREERQGGGGGRGRNRDRVQESVNPQAPVNPDQGQGHDGGRNKGKGQTPEAEPTPTPAG